MANILIVDDDFRMPQVDGLRLIRELIAHDPEAAILAVSGAADGRPEGPGGAGELVNGRGGVEGRHVGKRVVE